MVTQPTKRHRSRYIPALDGIRTLAVAAVILYHLVPSLAPGGMQGVTVFFVLSGFLITHLLLEEHAGTGRIDLKGFWHRRFKRLVPAIVAVIVVTAALCTGLNHVMLTKMRPDIIPSALFVNNWWQIFNQQSYFNAVGDPSPLTHFWSLAIEMQFYLVWPVALMIALNAVQDRRRIRRATFALACVSALEMALLYNPAVDPSRVYYGTDTRAFSLLLGAWLALIPHADLAGATRRALSRALPALRHTLDAQGRQLGLSGQNSDQQGSPTHAPAHEDPSAHHAAPLHNQNGTAGSSLSASAASDLMGVVGLLGTLALMAFTNGYSAFPYRGGILLASIFAVMLVAACAQPESRLARIFAWKPLVWLGQRSYGIYLWHYPLLLLMNPASDVSAKPWWVYALQIAVVVAVAEASYRWIETPFRHGAFGALLHRVKHERDTIPTWAKGHLPALALTGVACLVALGGIIFVPATSALSEEGAALLQGNGSNADDASAGDSSADSDSNKGADIPEGAYDITMIGDSVSLRAVDTFNQTFPHGYIDAAMNRQFTAGIDIYRTLVDQGQAGRVAVFALGTNGPFSGGDVDELMKVAGKNRIVVFVNNRAARPWCEPNNQTLSDAAGRYKNVHIIDWFGASANRNELFDGDGIHLSDAGAAEYVSLIDREVRMFLPIHLDDDDDPRLKTAQSVLDALKAACTLDLKPVKPTES